MQKVSKNFDVILIARGVGFTKFYYPSFSSSRVFLENLQSKSQIREFYHWEIFPPYSMITFSSIQNNKLVFLVNLEIQFFCSFKHLNLWLQSLCQCVCLSLSYTHTHTHAHQPTHTQTHTHTHRPTHTPTHPHTSLKIKVSFRPQHKDESILVIPSYANFYIFCPTTS